MQYAVYISHTTSKSAIHDPGCSVVKGKRSTTRYTIVDVDARTPVEARDAFIADEQLRERGLPLTTICKCAR